MAVCSIMSWVEIGLIYLKTRFCARRASTESESEPKDGYQIPQTILVECAELTALNADRETNKIPVYECSAEKRSEIQ